MTDEVLLKKCQKLGLKFSGKACKHTFKRKFMSFGVNVLQVTRNGLNQSPPETVSVSAFGLSMSPDNIKGKKLYLIL